MDIETPRRRFLELAGTGAALSVAGCNALQSAQNDGDGNASDGDGTGGDGGGGDPATVAVAVEPDREQLQQRQSEIQSELQNGNISRQEAQQQFQEAEQELLANATAAFESRTEESGLTAQDSIDEFGLFLVEGTPAALIETLSYEEVAALLPEASFQEASQQAGGGGGGGGDADQQSGDE